MPYLSAIYLYPIKALDPVSVREAKILESGALDFDREFAMLDAGGKFINGKRNPKIHRLRAHTYPETGLVAFQSPDTDEMPVFHLEEQKGEAEAWLSKFFEQPVTLQQNAAGGFPDDRKANGPTLIGRETLKEVASWYEGLTEESTRLRFRANLELGGALPFWEDRLFADPGYVVRFTIGDVRVDGIQPCARCIVPTRDPFTGEATPDFQRRFSEHREKTLPPFAPKSRFDHYYRLALNTKIGKQEAGKLLKVGMRVKLLDIVPLDQAEEGKAE